MLGGGGREGIELIEICCEGRLKFFRSIPPPHPSPLPRLFNGMALTDFKVIGEVIFFVLIYSLITYLYLLQLYT